MAAALAWAQSDQEVARRRCEEALAAERLLGTDPSAGIRIVLTAAALAQGRPDEAIENARQAVAMCRARGEPARLAQALAQLAVAHAVSGDSTAAFAEAEEIVVLTRRLASHRVLQNTTSMAAFALGASEPERALEIAREAVKLSTPGDHNIASAIAGDLAARLGHRREALAYFAKAIDTFHWLGNRTAMGTVMQRVGGLLAGSHPEAAAVLQGAGDALAPGYTHAPHMVEAQERAIAALDVALGAARREELFAQGAALPDAEAAAFAETAIARSLAEEPS